MPFDPLEDSITEALRAWQVQYGAGVALAGALETCASVCVPQDAQACFKEAGRRSGAGESFERLLDALAPILCAGEYEVLMAGWKGGRLDDILRTTVKNREIWSAARKRIRSGLILPLAILLVAALVLPLPALIASGDLTAYLCSALLPLGLAWFLWKAGAMLLRQRAAAALRVGSPEPAPPDAMDYLLLRLPFFHLVEKNRNTADCAFLLAQLIGAGVLLSRALEISARSLPNGLYRKELWQCSKQVAGGRPLATVLPASALWPVEFARAVEVGEKSGALDATFTRLGEQARERYEAAVKAFAEWLPRFLYGLVVLFVIYQIFVLVARIGTLYVIK